MDIHSVRQMLRSRSIYEIPLRVTYYARVSSESDEQLNSLGNQIQYYEDFIKKNIAWVYRRGPVRHLHQTPGKFQPHDRRRGRGQI